MKSAFLFLFIALLSTACAPQQAVTVTSDVTVTSAPQTSEVLTETPLSSGTVPTTEAVPSAEATSLASIFKIFAENVSDTNVDLKVDANGAVSPVNGTATLNYSQGSGPIYICTPHSNSGLLEGLIVTAYSNPSNLFKSAGTLDIGALSCNAYNGNPYNTAGDGIFALTPTAAGTDSSFNLVLSFVSAPSNNNGGGGGQGGEEGGEGGGGNCTPPLQWDPDLQTCVGNVDP